MAKASIFLLASLVIVAASACPEDYTEAGEECVRETVHSTQDTAAALCDRPGEKVLTGQDVDAFNAAVDALRQANSGRGSGGGNGAGKGNGNSGSGGNNPGRFYWVFAKAASSTADRYHFDDNQQAVDSDGQVIPRVSNGPTCLAGWTRSPDYVPSGCNEFYAAICAAGPTFYLERDYMSFADAKQNCINRGGNLVEIPDKAKLVEVQAFLSGKSYGLNRVYVGARDVGSERFYWENSGQQIEHELWMPGAPSFHQTGNDCVTEYNGWGLTDFPCDSSWAPSLCEL